MLPGLAVSFDRWSIACFFAVCSLMSLSAHFALRLVNCLVPGAVLAGSMGRQLRERVPLPQRRHLLHRRRLLHLPRRSDNPNNLLVPSFYLSYLVFSVFYRDFTEMNRTVPSLTVFYRLRSSFNVFFYHFYRAVPSFPYLH